MKTRIRGFTLVELMIVIVIGAILMTMAVPSFTSVIRNNRLVAHSNALVGTINSARSEAIAQQRTVTVCGSADGSNCNGDWGAGWMSFVDTDGNGAFDPAAETILRVVDGAPPGVDVDFVGATTVRYNSLGYAVAGSAGTLLLCDLRGDTFARAVLVSATGRVSMATDTDDPADGIVNDTAGNNVECNP